MPDYRIHEVRSRKDLLQFVRFPDGLYRDCPQYVPALHGDQVRSLTKAAPLRYCTRRLWLVRDGDRTVGRICAMVNPRYNERYGRRRARFGWFDCIDDFEVARLLFAAAEGWAKEQGMDEIHGPLYYNTFGRQGMLVEGYGNVPPFNCLYNFPYYNDFVVRLGYAKECDWVQYRMAADQGVPDKARRVSRIVRERYRLRFGSIDELKKDKALVRKFFEVYNDSFASAVMNYIPLTDEEIEEEAASVMPFISDKTSSLLLDEQGGIVAFGISFPSISAALQKAKGRLFPFGWWHLRRALRNYETMDLMVNGAAPAWQHKGVSAVYYEEMADKARRIGNRWAISNPQIESNSAVNIWNIYELETYMRRRCYLKNI